MTVKSALALTVVLAFTACAEPSIVYREVKVPVQCQIDKQDRPSYTGSLMEDFRSMLIYAEIIERDLDFCRTGKYEESE